MITIINTTKRDISYLKEARDVETGKVTKRELIVIPKEKETKSPMVVRKSKNANTRVKIAGVENTIDISTTVEEKPIDIPEPKEGVLYIVNKIIFHAFPERNDFILPASTKPYNYKGKNIVVCTRFVKRDLNK